MRKKINVFGSATNKQELDLLKEVLEMEWLGTGSKTDKFEAEIQKKLGLGNFLMLNSGSNALYMACKLLKIPPGSEIILPTFTWISCAQAVILAGHRPVFCDVEYDTQNVTAELIIPHITKKTGAIMIVHYAGKPVDINPIIDLGFPIIEDAAHAVDSYVDGKACGSLGNIGIYSFDAVKNIAAGEAGGITMRNLDLFDKAKSLRYSGIEKSGFDQSKNKSKWWEYDITDVFPKMMPNDLTSAVALAQLRKLKDLQQKRKSIWEMYQNAFKDFEWIETPLECNLNEQHSYFTYFIKVPKRDDLANFMLESGIYTNLRYHPLHLNKIYNQTKKKLVNSETLNKNGLNIPLHPNLSREDVAYVIDKIVSFYK